MTPASWALIYVAVALVIVHVQTALWIQGKKYWWNDPQWDHPHDNALNGFVVAVPVVWPLVLVFLVSRWLVRELLRHWWWIMQWIFGP